MQVSMKSWLASSMENSIPSTLLVYTENQHTQSPSGVHRETAYPVTSRCTRRNSIPSRCGSTLTPHQQWIGLLFPYTFSPFVFFCFCGISHSRMSLNKQFWFVFYKDVAGNYLSNKVRPLFWGPGPQKTSESLLLDDHITTDRHISNCMSWNCFRARF